MRLNVTYKKERMKLEKPTIWRLWRHRPGHLPTDNTTMQLCKRENVTTDLITRAAHEMANRALSKMARAVEVTRLTQGRPFISERSYLVGRAIHRKQQRVLQQTMVEIDENAKRFFARKIDISQ